MVRIIDFDDGSKVAKPKIAKHKVAKIVNVNTVPKDKTMPMEKLKKREKKKTCQCSLVIIILCGEVSTLCQPTALQEVMR